jgi:hypothetical protein
MRGAARDAWSCFWRESGVHGFFGPDGASGCRHGRSEAQPVEMSGFQVFCPEGATATMSYPFGPNGAAGGRRGWSDAALSVA